VLSQNLDCSTLAFGLTTKPSIESDYHPKWVTECFTKLPGDLCAPVRKYRCVLLTLESFQPCKTSNQTMLTLFLAEIGKIAFALVTNGRRYSSFSENAIMFSTTFPGSTILCLCYKRFSKKMFDSKFIFQQLLT
jgi:hypothetical protein